MRCIFVDNFRGFKEAIIPLKDVDFLVGENSTGKTSLLALINLMNSPSFWVRGAPGFESEEIKLGNFRDIVSAGAEDKSYFRIGLFVSEKEENNSADYSAYLITFKEKEGMPIINSYTYSTGGRQIQVIFRQKLRYKYEDAYKLSGNEIEEVERMFKTWTKEHIRSSGSYKLLKGPASLFRTSLGALNATLLQEDITDEKKTKTGREISFTWRPAYKDVTVLAPIRTRPKRTYDEYNIEFSPGGEHTPYLIKRYFRNKRKKEEFLKFIDKFGRDSGLFKTIDIKNFGRAVTSPFELDVAIGSTILKITNVGYGVSQVLPVIVEIFARPENTCFLIQQPEIHLHPRAQAALGSLFYELAILENKCFIVETHSDFIIDSFRLKYKEKGKVKKPEGQIIYFERFKEGNRLFDISILENGDLPEEQPKGYRDFFVKEQMRMLGY